MTVWRKWHRYRTQNTSYRQKDYKGLCTSSKKWTMCCWWAWVGVKKSNCANRKICDNGVYCETSLFVAVALLTLSNHTLVSEKLPIHNASSMLLLCVSLSNNFWMPCFRKLWTYLKTMWLADNSMEEFWAAPEVIAGTTFVCQMVVALHTFIEKNMLNFRTLMSSTCHIQCAPP